MQRLGQHFLKNKKRLASIAREIDIHDGDTIFEIGPGHGELTEEILRSAQNFSLIIIERDAGLATLVREKFKTDARVKVIEGNALSLLPSLIDECALDGATYKIAGNIPYYITGKLLRLFSELPEPPSLAALTIQREVAERIAAKPPRMNRLSAIVQYWATPRIIEVVPREEFSPVPKVDSAIITLAAREDAQDMEKRVLYYKCAHALFQQPRKTILNNLAASDSFVDGKENIATILQKIGVSPTARPQDLSIAEIEKLSPFFSAPTGV